MVKNIELEQLVINKLTQEQFDSIEEKNPAELYFITDAEADGGTGAQVEEMPEATEMNAGQIVQYVGETNGTYTNGFFYKCTETDGVYYWTQVNVQGGGDCLPITGGEMTGLLTLNATQKPSFSWETTPLLRIKAETEDGSAKLDEIIRVSVGGSLDLSKFLITCSGLGPDSSTSNLGNFISFWNIVYAKKLHNGAELAVPTEGGTLARVEDITAAVGDISTALTAILGE